jgi:hypothetical protein
LCIDVEEATKIKENVDVIDLIHGRKLFVIVDQADLEFFRNLLHIF